MALVVVVPLPLVSITYTPDVVNAWAKYVNPSVNGEGTVKLMVIEVNAVETNIIFVGNGIKVVAVEAVEFTVVFGNIEYIIMLLYRVPAVNPETVIEVLEPEAGVLIVDTVC